MPHIVAETNNNVLQIAITRPEKKNALTVAMYETLATALRTAAETKEIHAVLIGGSPGIFTAGNDIVDFMQNPPTGEDSSVFRFLNALSTCPKPIVAAVDGLAVGVGTTMLLHCDLVVASTRAKFHLPFINLALVPEGASSLLLPALVGLQRASEWFLLGEPVTAEVAQRAGFVNRVVSPEQLENTAINLAAAVAEKPPEAVQLTKKLLREPFREAVAKTIMREGAIFMERLGSPEAMQAFMAFAMRKS